MNFDFTDDQYAIKRTAHELLSDRFPLSRLRELSEDGRYDETVWAELCELGWPGIFAPPEHGGQGLGTLELMILMEELGYALAPVPFLSTVGAGLVIHHAGSDEQRLRWLPEIVSGTARASIGAANGQETRLVPDAETADVFVLVDGDGATLVEASDTEVTPVATLDLTRPFGTVRALGGDRLPGGGSAALDHVLTALAAELVGVAQRALEMAVQYACEREQFGRKIGAYQAVSHRCAQMLLEVESARSLTYYAAWAADAEPESLPTAASMAYSYASDAGWRVTTSALQVLGGIGFTWEHQLHLFLKRAKTDGNLFGGVRAHRERVAKATRLDVAPETPAGSNHALARGAS